jgi:ubiquinol-cytochrome c reductase iron-sulfur subunit
MNNTKALTPNKRREMDSIESHADTDKGRRRFLIGAASTIGAGVTGLFAAVLVDNMNPGKEVAAMGSPVDVDVSKIEPGQMILVEWKKKPVWIVHRDKSMLDTLSKPDLLRRLKDPDSRAPQQPSAKFVNGNYRALKPEYFIAVALCTHLQCVPDYRAQPNTVTPWWFGGFHCPCHGSLYDLSARVIEGAPAPLNIPIPPYYWMSDTVARVGASNANGAEQDWEPSIW